MDRECRVRARTQWRSFGTRVHGYQPSWSAIQGGVKDIQMRWTTWARRQRDSQRKVCPALSEMNVPPNSIMDVIPGRTVWSLPLNNILWFLMCNNFKSSVFYSNAHSSSGQLSKAVLSWVRLDLGFRLFSGQLYMASRWGLGWRARGSLKHTLLTEDQKSARGQAKHESIFKVSVYISSTNIIQIIDSYVAKATVRVTSKLRGKGCGCKILFQGSEELGTIIQPAMELLQPHLSSCLLETNASGYR